MVQGYHREIRLADEFTQFLQFAREISGKLHDAVLVDQVVCSFEEREKLLDLLRRHVQHNLVRHSRPFMYLLISAFLTAREPPDSFVWRNLSANDWNFAGLDSVSLTLQVPWPLWRKKKRCMGFNFALFIFSFFYGDFEATTFRNFLEQPQDLLMRYVGEARRRKLTFPFYKAGLQVDDYLFISTEPINALGFYENMGTVRFNPI